MDTAGTQGSGDLMISVNNNSSWARFKLHPPGGPSSLDCREQRPLVEAAVADDGKVLMTSINLLFSSHSPTKFSGRWP